MAHVDSWTWGVDTLRSSGVLLHLAEATPVVAVSPPPETDEQREVYAHATTMAPVGNSGDRLK